MELIGQQYAYIARLGDIVEIGGGSLHGNLLTAEIGTEIVALLNLFRDR